MAKKISKSTKNKAKKQVKKAVKKRPKTFITLFILLLIIAGSLLYFAYTEGYLDEFLNPKEPLTFGVHEQNDERYYYYTDLGFESGEYYTDAYNLTGDELYNSLHDIIKKDFYALRYEDAKHVLSYSDRDPLTNYESLRGMYDNDSIATYWIGTGEGSWQREHVWPNSKLGVKSVTASTRNQASDIHNLRAITSINQTRSNRYFASGSGSATTVGTDAFYPGDDHRGDVARILFYMDVMYDVLKLTNDTKLLENNKDTNYTEDGAYSGILDLLIEWHKLDPVDEFELKRNDFIHQGVALDPSGKEITPQGNRNPFIDKPELVHLIWEDKTIDELTKPVLEENLEEVLNKYKNSYFIFYTPENKYLIA